MTWQGADGTGGTGGGPNPDDSTRADWPVGTPPETPAQPPVEPPSPFAPGGPLADDAALGAQPPAAPEPPSAPPVAPPVAVPPAAVPPSSTAPASPWAPVDPAASWAASPVGGDRYSVPGAPGLVYAGAVPRAAAYIVDAFILGILTSIVALPFADGGADFSNPASLAARSGIAILITLVIDAVYFILFWTTSGRSTPGMKLFKLQVGDASTGNKLEMAAGAKRWVAYGTWLSIVGFVPALASVASLVQVVWTLILLFTTVSSPTKQGLHDRFAGSAMVRPAGAGNGLAWTCLVLIVILPIVLGLLLVPLIFLGGQVSDILSAVGESV